MNANTHPSDPRNAEVRTVLDSSAETQDQQLTPDRPPWREPVQVPCRSLRGFAAMDRKVVSEIARKGGQAAHARGTAHEFTSEEARAAGRKGGHASQAKRRNAIERP
jgi:general stress protein YciG